MAICIPRSFFVFAFSFLILASAASFGQGAKARAQGAPSDSDQDQAGRRKQWFMHGRVVPGRSAASLRYRAHLQKMQLRAARLAAERKTGANAFSAAAGWKSLGPAPLASDATGFGGQDYNWVSGRATAVAIDPADTTGNTVYVGGAYGGVWKSINAGPLSPYPSSATWSPLTDTQATLAVGSIAIQPGNSNVVLVGTGETDSSADAYYGLGILRSPDAGNTWILTTQDSTGTRSFAGLGFSKIAFSTATPNLVVAAAAGATQGVIEGLENPVSANRGPYYSTDGGQSWTYATTKDGGVVTAPDSASSVVYNAGAGMFFAVLRYHGLYSSSDGINWSRLANQLGGLSPFVCPANPASPSCPIYRGELAVVPGRNEMYVWYVDGSDNDQGIWRTNDGGNSWTELTDTGITNCGDAFGGCGTSQGSYNLELAAVPDGATATDLYAGAINLYKCVVSNTFPTCSPNVVPAPPPDATFLNLTHVYGCPPDFGSIAHVHPDQHGLAFMQVNNNTQAVMYFANDGGIYRALDGYTGLTTGTCGSSNQFDSLNQTLGSMTQFVSFSQHPNDPQTILGGTQDNGSPATPTSEGGGNWQNVNSGDGGYNAINPNNPTEWFTANTDVSIQRCTSGIACHAQDFTEVVSNATVGGDFGAFYTPYILDPQNSGELIVGTCRVWRGTTAGASFMTLSNDFETGGAGSCTGNEVNLVRSVTAGGIKDSNGFSNVIYAGTDGLGPLLPMGGHIWVTANASAGPGSWLDRTGTINPGGFPISGVAIDTSDATGNTAYVTIMGFHVSHAWKTSNAGVSWTDFTGSAPNSLPDAPANAVLIDAGSTPATGTVYVATDVGVFSSSTASPNWTEVGPAPSSGNAGYLPNVAVTALGMFNSGGTKKLRTSTYGRGMWEFTLVAAPDFEFAVSDNPLTVFVGQPAVFNGTLKALNGYNSPVNLSCVNGPTLPPLGCSATPPSPTPSNSGATFTVNASSPATADYEFNVHGIGTDTNAVTRDSLLTLHVLDFNLTIPSPASVTVSQSATSAPVNFQVTALGSFNAAVALSCTGLPAGANCNFQPSNSVRPTSTTPVAVTMTVSTSASTTTGTFPIAIAANATGAPSPKMQNLSLVVVGTTGFSISNTSGAQAVNAGATAAFTLSVSPVGSSRFVSSVTYSCATAGLPPLSNCSFSPTQIAAGSAATNVTLKLATTPPPGGTAPGTYTITVNAKSGSVTQTVTATMTVIPGSTFDFSIFNNTSPVTITAGQIATYSLDVDPTVRGNTFPSDVTFSCSGLPAVSTCAFAPTQVASGSGNTNVSLTIQTTGAIPASAKVARKLTASLYWLWLPLPGIVFAGFAGNNSRRKKIGACAVLSLVLLLVILQAACGGGLSGGGSAQPGTPQGNYQVTVTAAMGSLSHSALVTLNVKP